MMYLLQYSPIAIAIAVSVLMSWCSVKKMAKQDREHNKKLEKFLCETRNSLQKYVALSDLLLELYKVPVWGNMFPELCDLEIEIKTLLEESDNVTAEDIYRLHRSFERLCVRMKYNVMFVQMHKLMQRMDIVTSVFIEEDLSVHFSKPHGVYRYQVSAGQCSGFGKD